MFEWDEAKRLRTLAVRGIDFVDARFAFDGRAALEMQAWRLNEERFLTVAAIDGKMYTVVWTWRGEKRRIISFRRARDAEERRYRELHR
jgi:uncharacterized DUF497 family protein